MAETLDLATLARANQQKCYENFGCSQFDSYDGPNGLSMLRLKICYIFYGMPQEGADTFENAYSEKQKNEAEKIVNTIKNIIDSSGTRTNSVGIIFVCGKSENKFLSLPVFRVRISPHDDSVTTKFVDQKCRVYENWIHWKKTNHFPAGEYCYPKDGFYTCETGKYCYDPNREPILEFSKSPSSRPISKILRVCDTTMGPVMLINTAVISVGCPFVGIAVGVGICGSIYGTIRAGQRLHDKATHEESLTDIESVSLWTTIISTPLCFVSSFANARLVVLTKTGTDFVDCSTLLRYGVTILNVAKIGINAGGVALSLVSLMKNINNGKLSSLEFLQFSMRFFFLTHTLMQPVTAKSIYIKAQNQYLQDTRNNLNDRDALTAFDDILKKNNSMESKANVIRALNVIDDPDFFFKEAGLNVEALKTCEHNVKITYNDGTIKSFHFTPCNQDALTKLTCCIQNYVISPCRTMIKVEDNEMPIFVKAFENEAVRSFLNEKVEYFATELGLTSSVVYLAKVFIQIIRSNNLDDITVDSTDFDQKFLNQLKHDLESIAQILKTYSLIFLDQMMAVYYFRQLGFNFPNIINSNIFHIYIAARPQDYLTTDNYVATETLNDSSAFDLHLCDFKFTAVVKKGGKQLLSIRFFKEETCEEIAAQFKQIHDGGRILPLNEAKTQIRQTFGLDSITILVSKENQQLPLELRNDLEDYYESKILWLLTAIGTQNQ